MFARAVAMFIYNTEKALEAIRKEVQKRDKKLFKKKCET